MAGGGGGSTGADTVLAAEPEGGKPDRLLPVTPVSTRAKAALAVWGEQGAGVPIAANPEALAAGALAMPLVMPVAVAISVVEVVVITDLVAAVPDGCTNTTFQTGVNSGNGLVTITCVP